MTILISSNFYKRLSPSDYRLRLFFVLFIYSLLSLLFQSTDSAQPPCSTDETGSCFRRIFLKFNKSRIFNCDEFRAYAYCYTTPPCSGNQASSMASKVYRETAVAYLPKEFFAALYAHWKDRCQRRSCDRFEESQCRRGLRPTDKDYDHALLLEWHGQRLQFELGMVPKEQGCSTLRNTMTRWYLFRTSRCLSETDSFLCYCNEQQNRFSSNCALNCQTLTNMALFNGANDKAEPERFSNFTLGILFILIQASCAFYSD